MSKQNIVTQSFMMPAGLYLRLLLGAFLRRNWAWGIVIISFFVGLGYFTVNAVYVAVILFFALIPAVIFHFFVTRLTRPDERRVLREHTATVDEGGIVFTYPDGLSLYYPWESFSTCTSKRHYYLLSLDDEDPPFLYLPKGAFSDEAACLAFEKLALSIESGDENGEI